MQVVHQSTSKRALLFPGQGAHDVKMLAGIKDRPVFKKYYPLVEVVLGDSPLEQLTKGNTSFLNQNLVSSLLTVLTSKVCLEQYLQQQGKEVHSLAGYSVGQWMALHISGVIDFEQLIQILKKRCTLMDACFNQTGGAMLGVIGVKEQDLVDFCRELEHTTGGFLKISNYNSVGQYSVAGATKTIEVALDRINQLNPKKALRLPVSGAWHCALLQPATELFLEYLKNVDLKPTNIPIIDNVTGQYLPTDSHQLKRHLADHISHPVRWMDGIRYLAQQGCQQLVEIGYGKVLTKFGFFIDFNLNHQSYYS